ARPQHLVWNEAEYLPSGGRKAGSGVDGLDFSARAAAESECAEPGRVECLPHPHGLAPPTGMEQRRDDSGPGRRGDARVAAPSPPRIHRAGIALLPDPLPQPANPRTTREGKQDHTL